MRRLHKIYGGGKGANRSVLMGLLARRNDGGGGGGHVLSVVSFVIRRKRHFIFRRHSYLKLRGRYGGLGQKDRWEGGGLGKKGVGLGAHLSPLKLAAH